MAFETHFEKENMYVVFFVNDERPPFCADDEEQLTKYFIQVDIWSKGDYTEIEKQVKQKMQGVCAIRTSVWSLCSPDIQMYQKVLRFVMSMPA
ncbi:hypothetical protein P7H12_24905 [Paenibacillus larvae]|nr:hypothetical protein [Paenibacillus larvae]MDT2266180.1 hypothetical protein [Paenibacillus larvae]